MKLTYEQSHTILGSKSQRGLTQMALDVLFSSISQNIIHPTNITSVFPSISVADVSEAQIIPASMFLDMVYGDGQSVRGSCSRAQTPMMVSTHTLLSPYSTSISTFSNSIKRSSPLRNLISFFDQDFGHQRLFSLLLQET